MTLQSAPYYWITCDATDCDERLYGNDDATAWATTKEAEDVADDCGWRQHAGRWYCDEHPDCPLCGKPVDDPDMVWADDQLWHQACMPGGAPVGMVRQLIGMPDGASE